MADYVLVEIAEEITGVFVEIAEEVTDVSVQVTEEITDVSADVYDAINDHRLLGGLEDDDHEQYIKTDGTLSVPNGLIGAHLKLFYKRIASSGTAPTENPSVLAVGLHHQHDSIGNSSIYSK